MEIANLLLVEDSQANEDGCNDRHEGNQQEKSKGKSFIC